MAKNEKTFDAVRLMRSIRDDLKEQMHGLTSRNNKPTSASSSAPGRQIVPPREVVRGPCRADTSLTLPEGVDADRQSVSGQLAPSTPPRPGPHRGAPLRCSAIPRSTSGVLRGRRALPQRPRPPIEVGRRHDAASSPRWSASSRACGSGHQIVTVQSRRGGFRSTAPGIRTTATATRSRQRNARRPSGGVSTLVPAFAPPDPAHP